MNCCFCSSEMIKTSSSICFTCKNHSDVMVIHTVDSKNLVYWKSICKNGIEIASVNRCFNEDGFVSEIQIFDHSKSLDNLLDANEISDDNPYFHNGFFYINEKDPICLNIKIDIDPSKFDEILTRINKLLVFL